MRSGTVVLLIVGVALAVCGAVGVLTGRGGTWRLPLIFGVLLTAAGVVAALVASGTS